MSESHSVITLGAIVTFLMLLFYMFVGLMMHKCKDSIGHEASFTIIVGMIISYLAAKSGLHGLNDLLKFSDNMFFYVCLPPIVFASGFNMQRGNFFSNIGNIIIFGVFGTFVCFTTFSIMTVALKNSG